MTERLTTRTFKIEPRLWTQVRVLAAYRNTSAAALVREALVDYLARHGDGHDSPATSVAQER